MTTSRREFFKTAAMGAVGAGAAFGTVAAEAKAAAPSKYDIIILGAGCGGLTCAVRAAENGLKPLLLEKMAMPAGNTIYAAGFLLGVNTSFQKAKNVQGDSAEQFLKDWMKVTQGKADEKLARVVCENADATLEWLHGYCGINFAAGSKLVWPMLSRAHLVVGGECQDFCVWGGYSRGSPTRLPFVFEMQYARPDAIAGAKVEGPARSAGGSSLAPAIARREAAGALAREV